MYLIENLTNGSTFTAPEWAQSTEQAMMAAAAAVACGQGNLTLGGEPAHFTLTNSRGTTQAYRVLWGDPELGYLPIKTRAQEFAAHVQRRSA